MPGLDDDASHASEGERVVARVLEGSIRPTDRVWPNLRVTDDHKNAEVDFFLALPGAGFAVLEVKGGQITHDGDHWVTTGQNGKSNRIDPVRQAREGMYGLRTYVESDPRWGSRGRIRWAHAVVFPFTRIADDFALPDCPRHMVFGRDDLDDLVGRIGSIAVRQQSSCRVPTAEDVEVLADILRGRGLPQADVISLAPSGMRWPIASPSSRPCCWSSPSSSGAWRSAAAPGPARPGWRWSRPAACARTASESRSCATHAAWRRTSSG